MRLQAAAAMHSVHMEAPDVLSGGALACGVVRLAGAK